MHCISIILWWTLSSLMGFASKWKTHCGVFFFSTDKSNVWVIHITAQIERANWEWRRRMPRLPNQGIQTPTVHFRVRPELSLAWESDVPQPWLQITAYILRSRIWNYRYDILNLLWYFTKSELRGHGSESELCPSNPAPHPEIVGLHRPGLPPLYQPSSSFSLT